MPRDCQLNGSLIILEKPGVRQFSTSQNIGNSNCNAKILGNASLHQEGAHDITRLAEAVERGGDRGILTDVWILVES